MEKSFYETILLQFECLEAIVWLLAEINERSDGLFAYLMTHKVMIRITKTLFPKSPEVSIDYHKNGFEFFTNDNDSEVALSIGVTEVLTICGQTYDRQNNESNSMKGWHRSETSFGYFYSNWTKFLVKSFPKVFFHMKWIIFGQKLK